MLSRLPDYADPYRLCGQGKAFAGRIALKDFPRLAPLLASTDGEAAFVLKFGRDAGKRHCIEGEVQGSLPLICQRCLTRMDFDVDSEFKLALVSGSDEAERLPVELDPFLMESDRIDLQEMIEDELLLSIPTSPMHLPELCVVDLDEINQADEQFSNMEEESGAEAEENPFAILAQLKSDENESS